MRKLLDDRLVKLINRMSENPYEYYKYESTPMTKLVIDDVETTSTGNLAQIYLVGEIEPHTRFYKNNLNLGLTATSHNQILIYLPKMIDEDFELYFYFNLPEGIESLAYTFFFEVDEEDKEQYYLRSDTDNEEYELTLSGTGFKDDKRYDLFAMVKNSPSTEENILLKKINGIVYIITASA